MQSCCRIARRALSRRSLATSASSQASTSTSAASTSSGAVAYSRPIPEGKLPAYDEAVAFIEQDKQERLKAIEEAKKQMQSLSADAKAGERIVLYNTIQANEIASLINDPETRWKFRNGQGML